MKSTNRDLLVLSKHSASNKKDLDREVQMLHKILYEAESIENFCIANEIIDINRYKVIQQQNKIQRILQRKLRPFQFVNNKN